MSEPDVLPEIKQIIGAMIFAAGRPLSVSDMRKCLVEVAKEQGGASAVFEAVKDSHVREALSELQGDINERHKTGFVLTEVAGGFRYQSDRSCGAWIKHLLEIGRPNRLSKPALETLAIIAYRQPISKADIESVRGVNVDHIMKSLLEYRLIKISGRSELPGRPFLYGTTQLFLEHFGLKNLKDLNDIEPMLFPAKESAAAARKKVKEEAPEEEEDIFEKIPEDEQDSPEGGDLDEDEDDADEFEDEDSDEDDDEEEDV